MKLNKGWAIVFAFGSLALILGLSYGATLPNLPHLAHLPMALVAWGTLMLALATFQMITNSNEQEKRRRDDALAKEKRDGNELLLNEIIEWSSNVAKSAIYRQETGFPELLETKLEYKYHKAKGKYIDEIVSSSFKELSDSFNDINNKLDEAIRFTEQILSGTGNVLALKDYETKISVSVEKLLEETAGIKTRDIT